MMHQLGPTPNASLTTKELATFLGISSWRTTIDLPFHSYFVELHPFADGVVGESLIECGPDFLLPKKQKVTVMLGREGVVVLFSHGGSVFQRRKESPPFSDLTWPIGLPPRVGLGDFVLSVQAARYFDGHKIEDMPPFAKGFLLRIRAA
jgi:hypothetical protein